MENALMTDRIPAKHPPCLVCDKPVCLWLVDGTAAEGCFECDLDGGEPVDGGHVHDGCREKFIQDAMAHDIEQALRIRLPLGMEPWAVDRSRNLAVILYHDYVKGAK